VKSVTEVEEGKEKEEEYMKRRVKGE